MQLAKVRCPITGDVSSMSIGPAGAFDEYRCPTCGCFRISGAISLQLSGMAKSDRLYRLATAKTRAPVGAIPIIQVA